jgi:hypothetical protein
LTDRDHALIRDVEKYRLLTTRQIQRLHFDRTHPTAVASARAANRTLTRLRDAGVLKTLQRRIGGARSGSAGFVWYIAAGGERLLQALDPANQRGRRNYREPSRHFVEHTLAIAEIAVATIEASRRGDIELLEVQTEPASWQTSLSRFGTVQTLKPDLQLVTASGEYEHHWFLEIDMASEHLPVIVRQCLAYQAHRATGRYEAEHGIYPAVVWVVPTEQRRRQIERRIVTEKQLDTALFIIVVPEQVPDLLRSGAAEYAAVQNGEDSKQPGGQEGGTAS